MSAHLDERANAPPLVWHSAKSKPDAETTVLCWRQRIGDWYSGWWDGENWYDTSNGEQLRGVTHWAEPEGPNALVSRHARRQEER